MNLLSSKIVGTTLVNQRDSLKSGCQNGQDSNADLHVIIMSQ